MAFVWSISAELNLIAYIFSSLISFIVGVIYFRKYRILRALELPHYTVKYTSIANLILSVSFVLMFTGAFIWKMNNVLVPDATRFFGFATILHIIVFMMFYHMIVLTLNKQGLARLVYLYVLIFVSYIYFLSLDPFSNFTYFNSITGLHLSIALLPFFMILSYSTIVSTRKALTVKNPETRFIAFSLASSFICFIVSLLLLVLNRVMGTMLSIFAFYSTLLIIVGLVLLSMSMSPPEKIVKILNKLF
ncbi:MAG: hypothetical protein ACP6IP_10245 [Candidatus Njordarchaeia archaeon]